ncbi:MAG: hypothetical protein RLZ62_2155 [Bacteroidota bacterium]|jgi:LysM repeat protein
MKNTSMIRYLPLLLLLPALLPLSVSAQSSSSPVLRTRDSLLLVVEDGEKFLLHPVRSKQTLFSLGRYYYISVEDIIASNNNLEDDPTLKTGTRVRIPVPNKAIRRFKGTNFDPEEWVSIYYVVRPGDNLYHISKRYFEMDVKEIKTRNRLGSDNINPGQRLHVGWFGIEGIHPDWRPVKKTVQLSEHRQVFVEEIDEETAMESQGVCQWNKTGKESSDLYAMHRTAKIGSVISVTNPMNNKTVYAKVISRIPEGFEKNLEVYVSHEAAKKLGAVDERFFVKVKYMK